MFPVRPEIDPLRHRALASKFGRTFSSHVAADGAVAGSDRGGVAYHHAGVLPAAGELDGMGGGAAGSELDGESHAAAVRGSAAIEAGRGAGGRKPAVHLVDAETDDGISGFRCGRRLQATNHGRAAADQAPDVGMIDLVPVRVVRPELGALAGIETALEQRAEDRRVRSPTSPDPTPPAPFRCRTSPAATPCCRRTVYGP